MFCVVRSTHGCGEERDCIDLYGCRSAQDKRAPKLLSQNRAKELARLGLEVHNGGLEAHNNVERTEGVCRGIWQKAYIMQQGHREREEREWSLRHLSSKNG